MIDQNTKLRVQALVDGELPSDDAREIAALIERDPEAHAIWAELGNVRQLLAHNELEVALPESREFFWSKIEKEITRSEAGTQELHPRRPWWIRVLAPAAGFAMLITMVAVLVQQDDSPQVSALREIETPLEEASTISFYSPSAGMTVVWVQTPQY